MKKPIFAVAALFIFMFTIVSGFSVSDDTAAQNATTSTAFVVESGIATPDVPVSGMTCPNCGEVFADGDDYNAHIEICTVGKTKDYVDLTVKELLEIYLDVAEASANSEEAEAAVIRVIDAVENMGTTGSMDEVNEAIAELEALDIPGTEGLADALKEKIKDMYAGETATAAPETTTEPATEPTTESACDCGEDDNFCGIFSDLFECIKTFFCRLFDYIINTFC